MVNYIHLDGWISTADVDWLGRPILGGFPVVDFWRRCSTSTSFRCSCVQYKVLSPASMHGVLVWQELNTAVVLKMSFVKGSTDELRDVLSCLMEYKA